MATNTDPKIVKISTKIWRPVIDKLTRKMLDACLRRDAYLDRVLRFELPALDEEVSLPNSAVAERFIQERLESLDRRPVSLALSAVHVARLDEICRHKRIVRDAFFNRLLLLLAAKPALIDGLYFGGDLDGWRDEIWQVFGRDRSVFDQVFWPLAPNTDPLWPLRASLALYAERTGYEDATDPSSGKPIRIQRSFAGAPMPLTGIYTTVFRDKVGGFKDVDFRAFSVHLPDHEVPATPAYKAEQEAADLLL